MAQDSGSLWKWCPTWRAERLRSWGALGLIAATLAG
jgi:hypothetical protein